MRAQKGNSVITSKDILISSGEIDEPSFELLFRRAQELAATPFFTQPSGVTGPSSSSWSTDYRAFCLCWHQQHGMLLLHCTRKKSKPSHYQLPGGHVDDFEFHIAEKAFPSSNEGKGGWSSSQQTYQAARMACARELYEETGMDLTKSQLERFLPLQVQTSTLSDTGKDSKVLINEHKKRVFFILQVNDDDFPKKVGCSLFCAPQISSDMFFA